MAKEDKKIPLTDRRSEVEMECELVPHIFPPCSAAKHSLVKSPASD